MEWLDTLRWLHIIGAAVLLGTGAGIAFFMWMAHRTGDTKIIAHGTGVVVLADFLFTASAVLVQPVTGALLARQVGWTFSEPWLVSSISLYAATGALWLPVVWMQIKMRDLAKTAMHEGTPLPTRYHQLFRRWIACGIPAFAFVLTIFWLMVSKPKLW